MQSANFPDSARAYIEASKTPVFRKHRCQACCTIIRDEVSKEKKLIQPKVSSQRFAQGLGSVSVDIVFFEVQRPQGACLILKRRGNFFRAQLALHACMHGHDKFACCVSICIWVVSRTNHLVLLSRYTSRLSEAPRRQYAHLVYCIGSSFVLIP